MSEQFFSNSVTIDNNNPIDLHEPSPNTTLALYGLLIFTKQAGKLKDDVAEKGAEISQRQEKIKFIHQILQAINKLSTEEGLDIREHPDIQEKLKVAKELGIDFDENKLQFTPIDRDFLKESLLLTEDELSNDNKMETQKMQKLIQAADHWLTLANLLLKNTERNNKSSIDKLSR